MPGCCCGVERNAVGSASTPPTPSWCGTITPRWRSGAITDVAPIDGVMLAPGEQALKVEVDVIPEHESGVIRPAFVAMVR